MLLRSRRVQDQSCLACDWATACNNAQGATRCDVWWTETGRDTLKWAWANGGGGWYCVAGSCAFCISGQPAHHITTPQPYHLVLKHTNIHPPVRRLGFANSRPSNVLAALVLCRCPQCCHPRCAFATASRRPRRQHRWLRIDCGPSTAVGAQPTSRVARRGAPKDSVQTSIPRFRHAPFITQRFGPKLPIPEGAGLVPFQGLRDCYITSTLLDARPCGRHPKPTVPPLLLITR